MSVAITEGQTKYIRWLAKQVRCPIPFPEALSDMEASWLIRDLRIKLGKKRAYMLIR